MKKFLSRWRQATVCSAVLFAVSVVAIMIIFFVLGVLIFQNYILGAIAGLLALTFSVGKGIEL